MMHGQQRGLTTALTSAVRSAHIVPPSDNRFEAKPCEMEITHHMRHSQCLHPLLSDHPPIAAQRRQGSSNTGYMYPSWLEINIKRDREVSRDIDPQMLLRSASGDLERTGSTLWRTWYGSRKEERSASGFGECPISAPRPPRDVRPS